MRDYPFIEARWYTPGPRHNAVDLIVIHDAEYPEELDGAEAVAKYFARVERKASAHFVCDADSTVQCVGLDDIAYHAPGANHNGVGIELCGYAKQTTADWLDDYGVHMLRDQAAPLVRGLLAEFGIPLTWLNVDDLKKPQPRGITSHWNVSLAYRKSTHTDPGSGFPHGQFLDWCKTTPAAPPHLLPQEDDMPRLVHFEDADGPANYLVAYDMAAGKPVRRTIRNTSQEKQLVGGGGITANEDGGPFEVTNNEFLKVYEDLGPV